MNHYIIAIARSFGSGGKQIAKKLAEELGIPWYEKEILTMASLESGINESLFTLRDEKLRGNYLTKTLLSIHHDNIIEPHEKSFTSDNNLYNIQRQIILGLAESQSCIIVGKCADYILRDRPNAVSIFISAPIDACAESIMNKMSVTEEEAKQLIKKTDKYRGDYYKYYTHGRDWISPENYDLILNSARIGRDKCVEVIKSYLKTKLNIEV